jgi:hypothetical protein
MTKLFTRQGDEFTGTVESDGAGKAVRYVNVACDRCHVINGQRLWVMGMENGRPYSKTGFNCWTCNNTGVRAVRKERLYTADQLARANKTAATRAARKAETDRIAAEQAQAALVAKEANFRASNVEFIAKLDTLDGEFWDGFKNSFYARREAPTERQIGLVMAEVAKRQKNAASGFVGAVGDKVSLTLTVERIIVLHSEFYGNNYITIARDEQGNVVTYKGRTDLGVTGDTVTVKASIKEHAVYNGIKQTVIQRPKVVEAALG